MALIVKNVAKPKLKSVWTLGREIILATKMAFGMHESKIQTILAIFQKLKYVVKLSSCAMASIHYSINCQLFLI